MEGDGECWDRVGGWVTEIKKAFAHFDKNGDGSISLAELESAMKELGQSPTRLELKLLMKEADADGSPRPPPHFPLPTSTS